MPRFLMTNGAPESFIHPLMTMLGGKMVVLQGSLAQEFGMHPIGPDRTFRDEDVAHFGLALEEQLRMFGQGN